MSFFTKALNGVRGLSPRTSMALGNAKSVYNISRIINNGIGESLSTAYRSGKAAFGPLSATNRAALKSYGMYAGGGALAGGAYGGYSDNGSVLGGALGGAMLGGAGRGAYSMYKRFGSAKAAWQK